MPRRGIMLQSFYDQLVKQALERARPRWVEARVLAESPRAQQWRITAQVSALAPIDYGLLLEDVRRQAEPLLRDEQGEPIRGLSLEFTGAMPLVHAIQRRLMNDLFYSYLCTFLVVTLVTTIVQAGILPGLVAMVPNTFPVLMVFGTLGWLGWPMDIGSVMTASIAMGLAVDDTLHFLTFFRRGLDAGLDRFTAVREGYRHSGTAMLQTSLVCGLGILVFAFSDFLPGARFSWMMTLLIAAALYGDLVLLPALLLSPLGRVFFTPPIAQPPTKAAASLATKLPVPLR
jgi:predicted RND superfamily exporter protein